MDDLDNLDTDAIDRRMKRESNDQLRALAMMDCYEGHAARLELDRREGKKSQKAISVAMAKQSDDGPGWVYVLQIKDLPNWYKIGETNRSPEERMGELERETGCPGGLQVAYAWYSSKRQRLEREVHQRLKDFRRPRKEWFVIEDSCALLEAFRASTRASDRVHLTESQIKALEERAIKDSEDKRTCIERSKRQTEAENRKLRDEICKLQSKVGKIEESKRQTETENRELRDRICKLQDQIGSPQVPSGASSEEPSVVTEVEPTYPIDRSEKSWIVLGCFLLPLIIIWASA